MRSLIRWYAVGGRLFPWNIFSLSAFLPWAMWLCWFLLWLRWHANIPMFVSLFWADRLPNRSSKDWHPTWVSWGLTSKRNIMASRVWMHSIADCWPRTLRKWPTCTTFYGRNTCVCVSTWLVSEWHISIRTARENGFCAGRRIRWKCNSPRLSIIMQLCWRGWAILWNSSFSRYSPLKAVICAGFQMWLVRKKSFRSG